MTSIVMSKRPSLRASVGALLGFKDSAGICFGSTASFLAMTKAFPGLTQFKTSPSYQNARKQAAHLEGMVKYESRATIL
jgi:hypothetical protein